MGSVKPGIYCDAKGGMRRTQLRSPSIYCKYDGLSCGLDAHRPRSRAYMLSESLIQSYKSAPFCDNPRDFNRLSSPDPLITAESDTATKNGYLLLPRIA